MKDKDFIEVSEFVDKQKVINISTSMLERASGISGYITAARMIGQSADFDFSESETLYDIYTTLAEKLSSIYSSIQSVMPHSKVIEIPVVNIMYINLYTAWQSYTNELYSPAVYVEVSNIDTSEYLEFFMHRDPFESTLPDYIIKSAQLALQKFDAKESSLDACLHFSKDMFSNMLALAKEVDNSFVIDIIESIIDFYNSYTLLLIKTSKKELSALDPLIVPGGKTSASFFTSGYTKPLAAAIPIGYHKQYHRNINFAIENFERTEDFLYLESLFIILLKLMLKKVDMVKYGAEVPFAYILDVQCDFYQIKVLLESLKRKKSGEKITAYLQLNII